MFAHSQDRNRRIGRWFGLTLGGCLAAGPLVAGENAGSQTDIRAYLVPRTQTTLSAHIDGEIQQLMVKEGDTFAQGAPLVVFDCALLAAQHHKAAMTWRAAIDKNKVIQRLAELHSVGTLEADASRAEEQLAEAELKLQETRMRGCRILAPFAGRVATLTMREHQYVTTGQVIMKLLDHRHLEMEMIVPSRWLTWLKVKTPFAIQIDETGRKYTAQVIRLGAEADPLSQSLKVVGEIVGDQSDLMPGMSGAAYFLPPAAGVAVSSTP
ncbi:MAG: HlyD family efflux transporter periplasmic adaptor subunit [Magnetococcales bacterium]|nr:HlyD family efflux transporter periplasmic adaptor subunit [Magnetococcales bacterium]